MSYSVDADMFVNCDCPTCCFMRMAYELSLAGGVAVRAYALELLIDCWTMAKQGDAKGVADRLDVELKPYIIERWEAQDYERWEIQEYGPR